MPKRTFHDGQGRFTSFHRASSVTDGGKRFRVVRTMEPIDVPQAAPEPEEGPSSGAPPADVAEMVRQAHALAARRTRDRGGRWSSIGEVL